tara:strand:+ start:738 stop:1679 length:942 start_codon:yes stop_codon:yes gene_type:complete
MKSKKIILSIFVFFIYYAEIASAMKATLFATVGDKAITQLDIINEVKTILILSGQSFTEDRREELQSAAIKSIIKRNIKMIEIEKYDNLKFSNDDLNIELNNLAVNVNMDLDTLRNTFITNDLDFSVVREQVKTEVLWNSLIFEIYKDRLFVNQEEINEQLKSFQQKEDIDEYLISEIILESVPIDQVDNEIQKIKEKIAVDGFEKVAINFSISETSLKGGNLGWINENLITDNFKSKIINTPVGEISEPVILPEGIVIFKVRDKRKTKKNKNLVEVKNQLISAEKSKILNMYSLSHYDNLRRTITINYLINE